MEVADYETLQRDVTGVDYIMFVRQNSKDPSAHYTQTDILPLTSSSDSEDTFVMPRAAPIPTAFNDTDKDKPWELNKRTGMWERGFTTWGPPSFILRVFNYRGDYKQQIFFGKTWKKFDRAVIKFDPNDEKIVRKYNKWLEYIFETFETGPKIHEITGVPWTNNERFLMRAWVNSYIQEKGVDAWASRFEWSHEVYAFNLCLAKAGYSGHAQADIEREFGQDLVIYRSFLKAQIIESRVHAGEKLKRKELYPKNFIPLWEGLREAPIETTAGDRLRVKEKKVAEEESNEMEVVADEKVEHDEDVEQTMCVEAEDYVDMDNPDKA